MTLDYIMETQNSYRKMPSFPCELMKYQWQAAEGYNMLTNKIGTHQWFTGLLRTPVEKNASSLKKSNKRAVQTFPEDRLPSTPLH